MPLTPSISKMNAREPVPSSVAKSNTKFSSSTRTRAALLPPRPPLLSPRRYVNETFPHEITRNNISRSSSIGSSMRSRSSSPYSQRQTLSISSNSTPRPSPSPHRSFPQHYEGDNSLDIHKLRTLDPSAVVFDANLSFVMGVNKSLKSSLRASPAHSQKQTASNYLTEKISNFLEKTDHIMEEWSAIGRSKSEKIETTKKSKSASNILIRGFQLARHQPSQSLRQRSNISESRESSINNDRDDDDTICEDQVEEEKNTSRKC
jgi:exonuclease VII large subunit